MASARESRGHFSGIGIAMRGRLRRQIELDDFHAGQKLFVAIGVALFGYMSLMAGLQ